MPKHIHMLCRTALMLFRAMPQDVDLNEVDLAIEDMDLEVGGIARTTCASAIGRIAPVLAPRRRTAYAT